jgi:hypothetical protein
LRQAIDATKRQFFVSCNRKQILTALFITLFSSFSFGQTSNPNRDNMLTEISKNDIADLYLGCLTCISNNRFRADSFFNSLPLDTAILYSKHQSHTVKYYSFLRILVLNDSLAFEFLKENILDSSGITIVTSCIYTSTKFNQLIATDYKRYINCKVKGYVFINCNRAYMFDKSYKKEGKAKLRRLYEFIKPYDLDLDSR